MTPAPFVDRPDACWFACAGCGRMYDGRQGHECPDSPLRAAQGITLAFLASLGLIILGVVAWLATR